MSLENLMKSLALGLEQGARLSADEAEAYRAILATVQRFDANSATELAAAMNLIKPRRSRSTTSSRTLSAQAAAFYARLEKTKSEPNETQRILEEMGSLLKQDVVEIAKRLGVRTNSRTTKSAALQGIATLSGRAIRERDLAERIRRGA